MANVTSLFLNIKITMEDILNKIKEITPDFYVSGSLSLIKFGVIKREPKDIDINVTSQEVFEKFSNSPFLKPIEDNNESVTEEELAQCTYKRLSIDGVDICVFFNKDLKKSDTKKIDNFTYARPYVSINAKKAYIKSYMDKDLMPSHFNIIQKHLDDIKQYHLLGTDKLVNCLY